MILVPPRQKPLIAFPQFPGLFYHETPAKSDDIDSMRYCNAIGASGDQRICDRRSPARFVSGYFCRAAVVARALEEWLRLR